MPEMPGVMTDILISMDDRLGLAKVWVGIGQKWLGSVGIGRIFVGVG